MTKSKPLIDRFIDKVDKDWKWIAQKDRHGYGVIKVGQMPTKAHRVSYQLFVGKIPEGACVLHSCDEPDCVNPDHLFIGTQYDNMQDMRNKGRGGQGDFPAGEQHPAAKLSLKEVAEIRRLSSTGTRNKELAEMYHVKQNTISSIIHMKKWKATHDIQE